MAGLTVLLSRLSTLTDRLESQAPPCGDAAGRIEATSLPADAFGQVSHSTLISSMADRCRSDLAARMRSAADDLDGLAGWVATTAREFRTADVGVADAYGSVTSALGGGGR